MPKKTSALAPNPSPSHGSKAAFVRSLPADTPAKEILAKAKSQGLKLSIGQIYNIRSVTKKANGGANTKIKESSVAAQPRTKSWAFGSKSAFVLALPDLSAKDIQAKAQSEGLELSIAQIYNVRSVAKKRGGKTTSRSSVAATPRSSVAVVPRATASESSHAEDRLRRLVAELGLSRSREIMTEVQAAFG